MNNSRHNKFKAILGSLSEPAERLGRHGNNMTRRSWWLSRPVWAYWSSLTKINIEKKKVPRFPRYKKSNKVIVESELENVLKHLFQFDGEEKRSFENVILTIWIQHAWNIQVFLSDIESCVEIFQWIILWQFRVIDEIGSVTVAVMSKTNRLVEFLACEPIANIHESAESKTILEAEMEVLDVDVLVWSCLTLTPQQETLLSCHFFNRDVLDGESQDDRPNHTESHFKISINDFLRTDRHESDAFWSDEIECFVDVGDLLKERNSSVGDGERRKCK